jgi:hypothetical protein
MPVFVYPAIATLAFALLLVGFTQRKSAPRLHAGLMTTSMAVDLALLLVIEFSKSAIGTVLAGTLTLPQQIHVAASSLAVVLYVPVFILGATRLFRPSAANLAARTWHRRLGYAALAARAVGFAFMFSMLGRS